ncbi:MAG: CCA tRNA nucleotidyltransferase [Planctomycetota bacterium]
MHGRPPPPPEAPGPPEPGDPPERLAAIRIIGDLREAGHEAYLAGGCVRDELLGVAPGDYDVATNATPERIGRLFPATRHVGAKFGVMQVRRDRAWIEVATFRTDGSYADRRRPDEVWFSDPEADAERRDFTINALFLDPLAPESEWTPRDGAPAVLGRVIDFVGGLGDLAAGVVRAVGDPERRLAEDQLRALRAVRFAARLGFEIEPATAHAIARHAAELEGISPERIGGELRRMLGVPSRARAAALIESLGLDAAALGEPSRGPGASIPRLAGLPTDAGVPVALAAWALDRGHDGDPNSSRWLHRWRAALCLSNAESDAVAAVLRCRRGLAGFGSLPRAARKRLAAAPGFSDALRVARGEDPELAGAVREAVEVLAGEPGGLAPPPWVTGRDLIERGMTPGPRFAEILDELYDAQLEGTAGDRDALLELLARRRVQLDAEP